MTGIGNSVNLSPNLSRVGGLVPADNLIADFAIQEALRASTGTVKARVIQYQITSGYHHKPSIGLPYLLAKSTVWGSQYCRNHSLNHSRLSGAG